MNWIKTRQQFLKEAKIRDLILPRQASEISEKWGEKYLDYEEVTPTNNIKQGKWKLSEDDKFKVLGKFAECDIKRIFEIFKELPVEFSKMLSDSIDFSLVKGTSLVDGRAEKILKDFNIITPSLDQIIIIFENVFRKVSVSDTMSDSIISKDEGGRPIKDSDGKMIKVVKEIGEVVFSNNLVNINTFLEDYIALSSKFNELDIPGYDKISKDIFRDRNISSFISYMKDGQNSEYHLDFEIFNRDIYLKISHNPIDILNMSVSKFYSSCQHLYDGGYRDQLLSNVFDPNSMPAYLLFDTEIFWDNEKISDQLPLSRMMVRNIEKFDDSETPSIFYDASYPSRMRTIFKEILNKYSGNVENYDGGKYIYSPDIAQDDELPLPYQDNLNQSQVPFIGKNTKTLYLSSISDWSRLRIDPNSNIKEVVIETTELPANFLSLSLDLDWIKFKSLDIKTLKGFDSLKYKSIALDKCKFSNDVLQDINMSNPKITKLKIVSCESEDMLDISMFKELEELSIIYTLNSIEELTEILSKASNIKKLVISGDLVDKDSKVYINSLKGKGLKIEIVGPVI
jgi:hypothetical protein